MSAGRSSPPDRRPSVKKAGSSPAIRASRSAAAVAPGRSIRHRAERPLHRRREIALRVGERGRAAPCRTTARARPAPAGPGRPPRSGWRASASRRARRRSARASPPGRSRAAAPRPAVSIASRTAAPRPRPDRDRPARGAARRPRERRCARAHRSNSVMIGTWSDGLQPAAALLEDRVRGRRVGHIARVAH